MQLSETMADVENKDNNKLLNAIRDKFASGHEHTSTSSSTLKLDIPQLKTTPVNNFKLPEIMNASSATKTSSTLNNFLLSQLNGTNSNCTLNTASFTLPQLVSTDRAATSSGSYVGNLVLPILKNACNGSSMLQVEVNDVSGGVQQLNLEPTITANPQSQREEPSAIDLRIALSSETVLPSKRSDSRPIAMDFEIPFIECDVYNHDAIEVDNTYCSMDITHRRFKHTLASPSPFGRIICLKYKNTQSVQNVLNCTKHIFKVKHKGDKFWFDTQSPDDKVQESLNRNVRRIQN